MTNRRDSFVLKKNLKVKRKGGKQECYGVTQPQFIWPLLDVHCLSSPPA